MLALLLLAAPLLRECVAGAAAVPVYKAGEPADNSNYRIPAVTRARGTLLAFAEFRTSFASDCLLKFVVVRRSEDDGETWGPMVALYGNDTGGTMVVGNPQVVFDRDTKCVRAT
jgi:sialidase-1